MAGENGYSLADIAAAMGGNGGFGGMGGSWLAILFLFVLFAGNGGWGNNSFANAIGYENLATSNEVQRGFDAQNSLANEREILAAVNSVGAQGIAATNQSFHDLLGVIDNRYNEVTRDIGSLQVAQAQALANQNQCCCETKMLIQETSAQNRYDALLNTNALAAKMDAGFNSLREKLDANKIESLQAQVAQLQLAQATNNVVRYPNGWTYNAGPSPFCNCGCGM